ncbi:MAG: NfeD family protein [Candidatus Cloacimonetes bacterium]|nr:NfeD family protein [Candidatus Cloacimonadota bacterium]
MDAWQIWMIIGILCIVIEIFDPAFFFLSLGAAAIITGLLSLVIPSTPLQILVFAVLSFLAFLSMRKMGKKLLSTAKSDTNVFALKGKKGMVTKEISEQNKGYVKIGGEEWPALEKNNKSVPVNAKIVVVDIEGNKLIVESVNPEA